ncbi:MAG: metal-dependent hydrolase [Planctomycetes bacterium]|nr:metal-dependent hydrolase [Planctomycetota bacterium]
MKLLLLGTSGYHPNDRRHTACLMLPELGVVFDAGTALYRVREHLTTDTLDIFLSHAHLDHVVGLTFMFDVLHQREMKHVCVHGEQAKLDAIRTHLFSALIFPVEPPFEMHSLDAQVTLRDGAVLTYFPLQHPGGSLGFRIDWDDRSMAYVTDTTTSRDADYIEKIRGVDLLIHECHFGDDMSQQAELTGHSCLTPVARVAAQAEVGRLVLVHINPLNSDDGELDLDSVRSVFPRIEIGTDNLELDF